MQPSITPAERSGYQRLVFNYTKDTFHHHLTTFIGDKIKYYTESLFPVPIFGLTYVATTDVLGWGCLVNGARVDVCPSSAYRNAVVEAGRGRDVVSLMLYPAFILCFEVIFEPDSRFLLPGILLTLPMAVEAVSRTTYNVAHGNRDCGAPLGGATSPTKQRPK